MANIIRPADYLYQFMQLTKEVNVFESICKGVEAAATNGKYTIESANDESLRLECAFKRVVDSIETRQVFIANDEEGLQEGVESKFAQLTSKDNQVRKSMADAFDRLSVIDPAIKGRKTEILSGARGEPQTRIFVYYNGKGDLFVRGENAQMRMSAKASASIEKSYEYGVCEQLSWDRGLPLTRLADHMWTGTFLIKDGHLPRWKYLIHDCTWSTTPDYCLKGEKPLIHAPTFDPMACSLIVPINVGFGNKLALFGEGEIQIDGNQVQLSWSNGVDLMNLGPSLWVLPVTISEDAAYKICIVTKSGEILWEKGSNRKFQPVMESIIHPEFDNAIAKSVPLETASSILNLDILYRQQILKQGLKEGNGHRKALAKVRPVPFLAKNPGKTFQDNEIIRIAQFSDVKEIEIEGEIFYFYYTDARKAVVVQSPEGCSAGTSAMLIMDNGKLPKAEDLKNRQAASFDQIAQDIKNAGLDPLVTPVSVFKRSLGALRAQILQHGPAFVRTKQQPDGTGHAMVIDEISEDLSKVRIRDPWHGWDFIVQGKAFQRAWNNSLNECEDVDSIVQVKNGIK